MKRQLVELPSFNHDPMKILETTLLILFLCKVIAFSNDVPNKETFLFLNMGTLTILYFHSGTADRNSFA